jgi:hypothetical protein
VLLVGAPGEGFVLDLDPGMARLELAEEAGQWVRRPEDLRVLEDEGDEGRRGGAFAASDEDNERSEQDDSPDQGRD